MGPSGQMRYGAREGFHDDIVISHALAVWSLQPLYKEVLEKPKTRIQQQHERANDKQQGEQIDEWNSWEGYA